MNVVHAFIYILQFFILVTFLFFLSLQNIAFNHDPGTSDDSGRASERLTTSSVAQRDQDSSRDRLSDVSDGKMLPSHVLIHLSISFSVYDSICYHTIHLYSISSFGMCEKKTYI